MGENSASYSIVLFVVLVVLHSMLLATTASAAAVSSIGAVLFHFCNPPLCPHNIANRINSSE
jgi:hypothetical protein